MKRVELFSAFVRCRMAASHLGIILEDFARDLENAGYLRSTIQDYLRVADVTQDQCHTIRFIGKGRKQRILPIAKSTRRLLQAWLKENDLKPEQPLLPNRFGHPLSRSGVAHQLQVAVTMATPGCPSLGKRKISPHQVRHTTALHMLQRGVRLEVIALWLGHEKLDTTHHYLEADLAMKEKALASLHLPKAKNPRFQPPDELLDFLEHL